MVDFERARAQMVESQLRSGGVTNPAILARMRALPRENFLPTDRRDLAYIDDVQWLGGKASRRFMAAPATLAKLLSAVAVFATGGLKALEARGRPEDRLMIEHLRSSRP